MKGRLLVAVQFGCLFAMVIMPSSSSLVGARALVATLLVAIATMMLAVAFVHLRESLTVFPEPREDAPFITHGIYRFVRHPMYLGVLLFGAGICVAKWDAATIALYCCLFIDLQIKYRYEDRLLAGKWPDASRYQRNVGALLPRRQRTD